MRELDGWHPAYGFARHKGYSTPSHMRALREHGPCPEHRRSFVNVGWRPGHGPPCPEVITETCGGRGDPGSEAVLEGYGLDGDGAGGGWQPWPGEERFLRADQDHIMQKVPGGTGQIPWWLAQDGGGAESGPDPGPAGCPLGEPGQENLTYG
jgi:hypothetical protein